MVLHHYAQYGVKYLTNKNSVKHTTGIQREYTKIIVRTVVVYVEFLKYFDTIDKMFAMPMNINDIIHSPMITHIFSLFKNIFLQNRNNKNEKYV